MIHDRHDCDTEPELPLVRLRVTHERCDKVQEGGGGGRGVTGARDNNGNFLAWLLAGRSGRKRIGILIASGKKGFFPADLAERSLDDARGFNSSTCESLPKL